MSRHAAPKTTVPAAAPAPAPRPKRARRDRGSIAVLTAVIITSLSIIGAAGANVAHGFLLQQAIDDIAHQTASSLVGPYEHGKGLPASEQAVETATAALAAAGAADAKLIVSPRGCAPGVGDALKSVHTVIETDFPVLYGATTITLKAQTQFPCPD